LEFYFSIPRHFVREFQSIFRGNHPMASLEPKETAEEAPAPLWYMKGFIDLVFEWQGRYYIVDYKSNFLGERFEDYQEARLREEMLKSGYDLQYHIYLVALHRYLRQRIPDYDYEAHMGGVYYLFIRGMSPELGPGFGIFKDRPGREVIAGMEEMLSLNMQGLRN
jgi:exodeoxyribonuclease V beta subunit